MLQLRTTQCFAPSRGSPACCMHIVSHQQGTWQACAVSAQSRGDDMCQQDPALRQGLRRGRLPAPRIGQRQGLAARRALGLRCTKPSRKAVRERSRRGSPP